MSRFEDLVTFNAVVETGSFTAAAERLDTDKSAVSRRIAGLEDRLGVQLLRRTTRRLNLTDTGRSFYEHAARIVADLLEAESAVLQEHGELRGRLRVALPLSFGIRHMGAPINHFNARHPAVFFDLDLSDRHVDLLQDNIDVAIRIGELGDSSLIARRLFKTRMIVCASPAYLQRRGMPETPDALAGHDCLTYSIARDPGHWDWFGADGNRRTVEVRAIMTANNGDLLSQAAADGLGIVMQPTFIAHAYVQSGELVPVLEDVLWPATAAWAVYPPARHLSYRVRAFIDFLVDYFEETPYWDKDCENRA